MTSTAAAERKAATEEEPPFRAGHPVGRAPLRAVGPDDDGVGREERLEAVVREQLALIGEDPEREGLVRTPERVRGALDWLTRGYRLDPEEVVGDALFEEPHEGMILVRDVEMYSLCEHHLLPFFGRVHVAYVPNGRIVGLSKLPRIVEVYARRLQVQERLTDQIADAVDRLLRPRGVGVVVEAEHLCMMMRGVQKQGSRTVTSALRGTLRDCPMASGEFLRLVHGGAGS